MQFVEVDKDVKLEVLDWGGTGRPLIFLAGLGGTAHVFDKFALNFIGSYHVYGITRRGYGASSAPLPMGDNYSADRLGDDVLAVMEALKLEHPVIAGHSIAGEELSSIGSRHPERVAGLVYLDAGYPYAFYNSAKGNLQIDLIELRKKLDTMMPGQTGGDPQATAQELLDTLLPQFEKDLHEQQKQLAMPPGVPERKEVTVSPKVIADYVGTYQLAPSLFNSITVKNGQLMTQLTGQNQFPLFAESDTRFFLKVVAAEVEFARDPDTHAVTQLTQYQNGQTRVATKISSEPPKDNGAAKSPQQAIAMAIIGGEQKYTLINCPVLAIYAVPHDMGPATGNPDVRAAQEAQDLAETGAQADAFEKGVPSAKVVRIAHANHAVFASNQADVLREMNAFMVKLPQ